MATTPGQPFTLALGFGGDATAAVGVARASASTPFVSMMDSYVSGWRAYDRALRRPPASVPSGTFPVPEIAGLVAASQLAAAAGDSVITAAVARGARATGWAQATVKG